MALSANTVWEVRTVGTDTNGGGFVTGASGTDWSQQTAAQYAVTDGVTAGTTTITSATANFGTDVVGNIMYVAGGTGSVAADWYQITARTNSTTITVDRSTGLTAGTGVTLNIGGALATPGQAAKNATVSGQYIYVKSGTYTITTSTAGAAGPVLFSSNTSVCMEGYSSTRGDQAARPEMNAGAITSVNLYSSQGNPISQLFICMAANGNSKTGVSGFEMSSSRVAAINCLASACDQASAKGFNQTGAVVSNCKASACTTGFATSSAKAVRSWADACTTGFSDATGSGMTECVASDCTGDGFVGANFSMYFGCTADGNTGDGFDLSASVVNFLIGCASTNNGAYGYNTSSTARAQYLNYCASYLNTTARAPANTQIDENQIILSGDPWTNAASDDYRPNNTAGAGASLRGITAVGVYGQTDNRDVGAVQHTDPAGGGGGVHYTNAMQGNLL